MTWPTQELPEDQSILLSSKMVQILAIKLGEFVTRSQVKDLKSQTLALFLNISQQSQIKSLLLNRPMK